MDTERLRAAYGAFLAEARAGGFGSQPPGEWDAERVVAHIARNNEELIAVTEAVLAGENTRYYNHDAISERELSEYQARYGSLDKLVEQAEQTGQDLCTLAARLPQDAPAILSHIQDGDRVALDQPVPWAQLLQIHAKNHVPRHTEQLRALRG
jgi:hypothetical protein